jgi:hypothetical protein
LAFKLDNLAPAPAAVGGDDEPGLAIVDAVLERLGAEAAKDDCMDCANTRAGQHGDDRLRHHRHVDGDAVARLDAHVFKNMRQPADVETQLLVGDRAHIAGLALKNNCGLVFPGVPMCRSRQFSEPRLTFRPKPLGMRRSSHSKPT